MTPASLAAPEITGKAFDGVNYVTWKPVKNATGYRIYRDNRYLGTVAYNSGNLEYLDYASLSTMIDSIKNGQTYTYTVVATGVQASRGTNTSTSNNTDFVMTSADILGDSAASVTITAKVPEVFSKVEAAKKVNVKYNGSIVGAYFEKPFYLPAGVSFAHAETGSNVDVFSYLAQRMTRNTATYDPYATPIPIGTEGADGNYSYTYYMTQASNQYVWTPAYAGKYKYQIITAWPNAFYNNNTDVSGDIEIPALNANAPEILAYDKVDGILIRFKDTIGAEYTLYRAEEQNSNTAYAFTSIVTGSAWDPYKTTCEGVNTTQYSYLDKTVEYGKKYVYLLTGTKDGKALSFNSMKPAVAYQDHNTNFDMGAQFAAFNNNGTVELSWKVKEGITYKVLKCTYTAAGGHTESYVKYNDSEEIKFTSANMPKLGVFVMTDTIEKNTSVGYRYTLIGTNESKSVSQDKDTNMIIHGTASQQYTLDSIYGIDTEDKAHGGFNGLQDKIYVEITAPNTLDMANAKFYRAEVAPDNKETYAGDNAIFTALSTNYHAEYVTPYTEVTLASKDDLKVVSVGTTKYVYVDSSLTEDNLAEKAYSYVVVIDGVERKGIYADSYKAITLPTIICETVEAKDSGVESKDKDVLSWNARYTQTIPNADPLAPATYRGNAAKMKVEQVWSNKDSIANVTENWTTVTDINLTDSTYTKAFSLNKDNNYNYLYIRVIFENAANKQIVYSSTLGATNPNTKDIRRTNRAYKAEAHYGHGVGGITIGTDDIYTSKTAHNTYCYIKMAVGSVTTFNLTKENVYLTYMHGSDAIYDKPELAGTLTKVTITKDDGDNTVNAAYTSDDYPTWYFSTSSTITDT
ncbi:MAG: hypothetical protein J6W76_07305, partial [Spirochaetales bacterium]|nr:hypothetical protein [Spirochaetales bacterium]